MCGPFCSVPPVGTITERVPARTRAATSVQVSSWTNTVSGPVVASAGAGMISWAAAAGAMRREKRARKRDIGNLTGSYNGQAAGTPAWGRWPVFIPAPRTEDKRNGPRSGTGRRRCFWYGRPGSLPQRSGNPARTPGAVTKATASLVVVQPVHDASVRVEVVRNHIEELAVLMFEATPQGEGNEIGVLNQTTCPGISEVGNVGQIPGCPPPVSEVLEIVSQLLQPLFPGRPVEENEAPFGFLPSTQEVIKTAAYLLEGVLDEVLTAECGLLDGDPEEGPRTREEPGGLPEPPGSLCGVPAWGVDATIPVLPTWGFHETPAPAAPPGEDLWPACRA